MVRSLGHQLRVWHLVGARRAGARGRRRRRSRRAARGGLARAASKFGRRLGREQRQLPARAQSRACAQHASPKCLGRSRSAGRRSGELRGGEARNPVPVTHATGAWTVERSARHGAGISAGLLSALPRIRRLFSALGARRVSRPVTTRNSPLKELGIVAALAVEFRPLGPPMSRTQAVATLADGSLIIASGMGTAAAAAGARRLVDAGAGALMSWGLAGGLDPALVARTIVLPRERSSPLTARCSPRRTHGVSSSTVRSRRRRPYAAAGCSLVGSQSAVRQIRQALGDG